MLQDKATTSKISKSDKKEDSKIEFENIDKREETITDFEWKERLLKIHNKDVKLEYMYEVVPQIKPYVLPQAGPQLSNITLPQTEEQEVVQENVSTMNYRLDSESIELEKGISVKPLSNGGMVSKKAEEGVGDSVVFFSPGGKMTLKPSNMGEVEEQEAELAMLHIISIHNPEEKIEISAYLRDSIMFKSNKGYQIELNQGEFTKYAQSDEGVLKFWDAKITQDKVVLAQNVNVEMDGRGVLKPSNNEQFKEIVEQYSETVIKDKELKSEFDFDNDEEWLKTCYVIEIGETKFYLKNPERENDVVHADSAIVDFYGFTAVLEGITAQDHKYLKAVKGKSTFQGYDVDMSDVSVDEADSKTLKVGTAETLIEGFVTIMNNYEYAKDMGVSYESADVKTQMNFGINKEKPQKSTGVAQDFVDFKIGKGTYSEAGFIENTRSENIAASKALEVTDASGAKRKSSVFEREIYTQDGFAKLEDPEFEFVKDKDEAAQLKGEGKVKFLKLPYSLTRDGKSLVSGKAKGKDAVKKVKFIVDKTGGLSAVFDDDENAELSLIGENKTENIIRTFTLGDMSIKNGYLNAGKVRMDRGLGAEQKLFDCKISGTVADESKKASIDLTGLNAEMKKSTLGTYEVKDFMGFLDGKVDYPNGKLAVSAKKELETENPEGGFFNFKGQNVADTVSVTTGIPLLQVKFGFKPSASIGGEVGFSAERGEAFDNEWKDKSELKLNGEVKAEGKASIEAKTGVEFGVPVLANIDLLLGGELGAKIEGALEGGTKYQYDAGSKAFQREDDFEFAGNLGGSISGELNLSSNINFVFLNATLFKFELLNKDFGKLEYKVEGSKDKSKKGLTEGWNIRSSEFSAEAFSKAIGKKYKNDNESKGEKIDSNELKKLVASSEKDTEDAWAVLCELRKQREDTLIVLEKKDKEALEKQIAAVTKEVKEKIEQHLTLLQNSKTTREKEQEQYQIEMDNLAKQLSSYQVQSGISKDVFEKAKWGGFDKEKYQNKEVPEEIDRSKYQYLDDWNISDMKLHIAAQKQYNAAVNERKKIIEEQNKNNKMAAIDLMIANMLGMVSKENLEEIGRKYDRKNKDTFCFIEFSKFEEDEKIHIYELYTQFISTGLSLYESQSSYYSILKERVFFDKKIARGTGDLLKNDKVRFVRNQWDFPKPFREIVVNNPHLTMEELLRYVLKNKNPDGSELNATPEQKLELLNKAFGFAESLTIDDSIFYEDRVSAAKVIKNGLAKKTGEKFSNIFSTSLDDVVKGENVIDIFEKVEKLQSDIETAEKKIEYVRGIINKTQSAIKDVENKQKDYQMKLLSLKTDSELALANKKFNRNAARNVVKTYSEEYIDKMKGNREILENKDSKKVIEWAMQNRT